MGTIKLTKGDVINFTIRAALNFFSEFLGTGILVFLGCMACVLGLGQPGDLTGISLCFAFAIIAGVEVAFFTSGGYINPMLVLSGMIFKNFSVPMGIFYILGELAGALVGFGLIKGLTPEHLLNVNRTHGVCTCMPGDHVSVIQAVFVEYLASSILVLVVCSQWDPRTKGKESISIKIGATVFALIYACGFYTSCGVNPARCFGPAVWNNQWKHHWLYWVSPIVAGVMWPFIYIKVFIDSAAAVQQKQDENE